MALRLMIILAHYQDIGDGQCDAVAADWMHGRGWQGWHEHGRGWQEWHGHGQQGALSDDDDESWGKWGSGGSSGSKEPAVEVDGEDEEEHADEEGWLDEQAGSEVDAEEEGEEEEEEEDQVDDAVAEARAVARNFRRWQDTDIIDALEDKLSTDYALRNDVSGDTMTVITAPSAPSTSAKKLHYVKRRGSSHRAGSLLFQGG